MRLRDWGVNNQCPPACRFIEAEGDESAANRVRHGAFKIIPRVAEGSWVVKQAVGQNTPVLLGRKLTTKYFRCVRVHGSHACIQLCRLFAEIPEMAHTVPTM